MYGVIVCPRCRRAKGVRLGQKTTVCSCGFKIPVAPARIRARASTARELVPIVARINAEVAGGQAEYAKAAAPRRKRRSRDAHARVVAAASKARNRAQRLREAALGLTEELVVFSFEDWRRVLDALGISDSEAALQGLIRANEVYEPRPGFFRSVDISP